MAVDIDAIQEALRADRVDGWLLYDFHGSNPIARSVASLDPAALTTRRWYYLIPAHGEPRALVHKIEQHTLDHLPGDRLVYAGREELSAAFIDLIDGHRRLAMEYSPNCAIPYISRVDAGTVDAIRTLGVTVVSSGDLVQRFEAVWNTHARSTHEEASASLYRIKDRTFALIAERIRSGASVNEREVQQTMVGWFAEEGLVSDSDPVVAAQENSGNPHYLPTDRASRAIHPDEVVLIDLWGKKDVAGSVYADITWVGYTGSPTPDEPATVFSCATAARDAAVAAVQDAVKTGRPIHGWEVDRAARRVIDDAGFGNAFVHRTGHSLGEAVHGNGVHMDDYETHDDRRLLTGTGFTIEPGIYFDRFGVRTEINMFVDATEARVTGPRQESLVTVC